MDADTAVSIGAAGTVSGLLCLTVKWMMDNESRKLDKVLQKLDDIERRLDQRGYDENAIVNRSDRTGDTDSS